MRELRWMMVAVAVGLGCGDDDTKGGDDTTLPPDTAVPPADIAEILEIDTAPPDTALPDTGTPDTALPPDTATPPDTDLPEVTQPGELGAACNGNVDCFSGYCVEGPEGYVCTRLCDETCPQGWDCKGVTGESDIVFLCVPRTDKLCAPCLDDLQCNGPCVTIEGERRCARSCDEAADCPSGFSCEAHGDGQRLCLPATGSCTCYADFDGGIRTCLNENALGTCFGIETCAPQAGWGACDAKTPAAETCNGQDDDCDAFLDEDIAEVGGACEVTVGGVGSCPGTRVCTGLGGLQCQGPTPTPETCDFEDDDCDGLVDEDFKTGEVYSSFDHCGSCNRSCSIGFPNAQQTTCQVDQGVAQCVVVSCQPGYIKQNDFQCIPDIVNLCEPCSDDSNCLGQDSACVSLSDGDFCAKACTTDDCPMGFSCETVVGRAQKQCLPTTGVCSCGPATQGLSRACSVTVSPPGQPSTTCAGTETCGAAGWGSCALPSETCNGFDDDCDGVVDDGFRNADGDYDRVAHCGACGISCLALSFENADPVCDATGSGVPQCDFTCRTGWVDVDGLPGCECRPTSTTDLPDPDGIDADCDGIDGEIDKSVFVAKTGDDQGLGTIDDPLRTIQAGIGKALALGRRDVLVATGVYVESIALADAVNVYGGYAPDFRARDRFTHESAILGADPTDLRRGAVNAHAVATSAGAAIVFDGFSVFGADNPAPGGSSYAIYLRDVGPHLTISNNSVVAGDGGNGAAGAKGADGARGVDGVPGVAAESVGSTCTSGDHASGGGGGIHSCEGVSTSGGAGGTRICPSAPTNVQTGVQISEIQEHGVDGANNVGSAGGGGEAGWDDKVQNTTCSIVSSSNSHDSFGAAGDDGDDGASALPGAPCVAGMGTVDATGTWLAPQPGQPGAGAHGGGGGGGGAAGGIDHRLDCVNSSGDPVSPPPYVVGGSGGGGGSGGCAGRSGLPGTSGGGSFAIFVAYASSPAALPVIRDNTVIRGRGGVGGAGGAGGVGGTPGFGAAGGSSGRGTGGFPLSCCGSGGGAGGNGGAGGHGAGGGGGCGGPAYGIFIAPVAMSAPRAGISGNSLPGSGAGGTGGPGGTSLGHVGPDGGAGANNALNF